MIASNKSRTWFVIALVISMVLGARSLQSVYGLGQGISPDSPLFSSFSNIVVEKYRVYYVNLSRQIVDVLDTSNPLTLYHVGEISFPVAAHNVRDIDVDGDYLYLAVARLPDNPFEDGVYIINVADPMNPQQVALFSLQSFPIGFLEVDAGYMYMGYSGLSGNIAIVDVSDPAEPQFVSVFGDSPVDIDVVGHIAYVFDSYEDISYMVAYDLSDPDQPFEIASPTVSELTQDVSAFFATEDYLYFATAKFNELTWDWEDCHLKVLDTRDWSQVQIVADVLLEDYCIGGLVGEGRRLYADTWTPDSWHVEHPPDFVAFDVSDVTQVSEFLRYIEPEGSASISAAQHGCVYGTVGSPTTEARLRVWCMATYPPHPSPTPTSTSMAPTSTPSLTPTHTPTPTSMVTPTVTNTATPIAPLTPTATPSPSPTAETERRLYLPLIHGDGWQ